MPEDTKDLENRIRVLEARIGKLDYPMDINSQKIMEGTLFRTLRAGTFTGGIPIYTYTGARTDTPKNGEIYLTNIGGVRRFCAYISGASYCIVLT